MVGGAHPTETPLPSVAESWEHRVFWMDGMRRSKRAAPIREGMEWLISLLTLEEKVQYSRGIIESAFRKFGGEGLAIAWTGGKDSTVMLWLYREVCRERAIPLPPALFIDEGSVFDEIFALVDRVRREWDVDVRVVKNTDVSDKAKKIGDLVRIAQLNERNRAEIAVLPESLQAGASVENGISHSRGLFGQLDDFHDRSQCGGAWYLWVHGFQTRNVRPVLSQFRT